LVSLHPTYLSRLFKQTTGIKLSEYIMQQKLELARRLLADKSLRIGEISTRVGFYTPSYFTRFFKRMTGTSPQEYRDTLG
jgi:two-component system response regulator YesN